MVWDQLELYAENYHRFTLQVMPLLEDRCDLDTLMQLYKTAKHYQKAFADLAQEETEISPLYLRLSTTLADTLHKIIGLPEMPHTF
ncbi:MAG: hypothetical protein AB7I41_04625 [Candidatus Sericytochromatia bacterium]